MGTKGNPEELKRTIPVFRAASWFHHKPDSLDGNFPRLVV